MKVTRNLAPAVCAALLLAGRHAPAQISVESLLQEMVDFDAVARWPHPEFTCLQASSYDRGAVAPNQPGWFANTDQNQFIRDEQVRGRTERVMLDVDGPGSLVRFWLTTDRNKQGVLRIYLDGGEEPALVFPAFDLLSGGLNPGIPMATPHPGYQAEGSGGNSLYLPIPYAKHCKVTWEEASQGARYYQINYRTYTPGTKVRTFTRAQFDQARPQVEKANKTLLTPPDNPSGERLTKDSDVPSHGDMSLDLPAGSHAVRRLELSVPPSLSEQDLRCLVLQMVCDGATNIWCPVSDFFGSGVGLNSVASWYRTVSTNGTMVSRWVMPYQRGARISLGNLGSKRVAASLRVVVSPWAWDDRSMYFHAAWHHETGLEVPPPRDWNFITISGCGVLVGDTLALFNPVATWYGEGDEKIWIDGEQFPSHFGTGTEDYYGYSYAPKPVHQAPFCGEPRIDQPQTQGQNTSIRSRNLDGIPFRKSLRFDMELIPWKRTVLTYAATTYWYAFAGAACNRQPQPDAASRPVPTLADAIAASAPRHFPGAIECEKLRVLARSAEFQIREQDMEPFDAVRWSGGAQLLVVPNIVGDYVEIEVPAPDDAPYQVILHATKASDYGKLKFSINGEPASAMFDGYARQVEPAAALSLGTFAPRTGKYVLRVQVSGTNPNATGAKYLLGLDYLELTKP